MKTMCRFSVSPEGVVTATPENQTVYRLDPATFTCSTPAGPDNMFIWLHNASSSLCGDNCTETNLTGERITKQIVQKLNI